MNGIHTKIKALILEVGEELEGLLETEEYVVTLVEYGVDIAKDHLSTFSDMEAEEIEAMFAGFDAEVAVGKAFEELKAAIDFIKDAGDSEATEYDLEYEAVKSIIESLVDEELSPIAKATDVLSAVVHVIFVRLDIQSASEAEFEAPIIGIPLLGMFFMAYFEGETFQALLNNVFVTNEETLKTELDGEALKALLASLADKVVAELQEVPGSLLPIVAFAEEVAEKYFEYDIEAEDSVFIEIRAVLTSLEAMLEEAEAFLKDEEALGAYLPDVITYGNLALEGIALIEEIEAGYGNPNDVVEYVARVYALITDVEPTPFEVTNPSQITPNIADAVGIEYMKYFDEGEPFEGAGGFSFDLIEEEDVYFLQVTIIGEFTIAFNEGEVSSAHITGCVYSFELPVEAVQVIQLIDSLLYV